MEYFKESEFICGDVYCYNKMNKTFLDKLDTARGFSDISYKLTSSWRSEAHNKKIRGSSTSSHLKGVAVDISTPTSSHKYEILKSLLAGGFSRIGVGDTFIHVDDDINKPQNVIWTY